MPKSAIDYYDDYVTTKVETLERNYNARREELEQHRDVQLGFLQASITNFDARINELNGIIDSYEARVTSPRLGARGGLSAEEAKEKLELIKAATQLTATAQRGAAADMDRRMESAQLASDDWTVPPAVSGKIQAGMPALLRSVTDTGDLSGALQAMLSSDEGILKASSAMTDNQRRVAARDLSASLVSAGVDARVADVAAAGALNVPAGTFDGDTIDIERAADIEAAKARAPQGGSGGASATNRANEERLAFLREKEAASPEAAAAAAQEAEDVEFVRAYVNSEAFDKVVRALADGTFEDGELTPEDMDAYRRARAIATTTPGAVDNASLRYFDRGFLSHVQERAAQQAGRTAALGSAKQVARPVTREGTQRALADLPPGYENVPESKKPLALAAWRAVRGKGVKTDADAEKLHRMMRDGSLKAEDLVRTAAEMRGGNVQDRDTLLTGVMSLQNEVNRSTLPAPQATVEKPVEKPQAPPSTGGLNVEVPEGLF